MKGQCIKTIVIKLYQSVPEGQFMATTTIDAVQAGVTPPHYSHDAVISLAALMAMKGMNEHQTGQGERFVSRPDKEADGR